MPFSRPRLGALSDRLSRLEPGSWRAVAQRLYLAGGRAAERVGLHVVRASYDSPIPRRRELDDALFERDSAMRGIDWDPERQTAFLERELAPFLAEFRPRSAPDAPVGAFRLDNATYDRVDAELLYALLRFAKPRRYVELGSGYSTLVAAEALARNAAEGHAGRISCFDPYPSPHVEVRQDLAPLVRRTSAEQLPESVVSELTAGDVLFVDTSHTVKLGGDVNRIVLELLPLAAPGVIVHFHDIFLPRDYSRGHLDGAHFWTEQYLLQAFLSGNDAWEVLIGGQAVALHAPERLRAHVPSFDPGVSPGAFWIRRRG
jgi:Methyltransferase domain